MIVGLACWAYGSVLELGFPLHSETSVLPFWDNVCEVFTNIYAAYGVGLLLLLIAGFIMKRINDIEILTRFKSQTPFLLFMILICTNAGMPPLREATIFILSVATVMYYVFGTFETHASIASLFNIGVLIAVTSLLFPPAIWLAPLFWYALRKFEAITLQGFMASFVGVFIVFWYIVIWSLWKHDFSILTAFSESVTDINIPDIKNFSIGMTVSFAFLVMSLFSIRINRYKNGIRATKMFLLLMDMSGWSLVMIFLYGQYSDTLFATLCLLSSIQFAYFIESMWIKWRFAVYYLFLAILVYSYLLPLWNF
jgi:hypothetical protein